MIVFLQYTFLYTQWLIVIFFTEVKPADAAPYYLLLTFDSPCVMFLILYRYKFGQCVFSTERIERIMLTLYISFPVSDMIAFALKRPRNRVV